MHVSLLLNHLDTKHLPQFQAGREKEAGLEPTSPRSRCVEVAMLATWRFGAQVARPLATDRLSRACFCEADDRCEPT